MRTAGLHDPVPEIAAARSVAQVHLVTDFARPAGSADHDRDPVDVGLGGPVVAQVGHGVAEQTPDDVLRLRALDLDWMNVRLADSDVEPAMDRNATRPEPGVRVGEGEPPAVLLDAEQHGVVDDPAVFRGDQDVLALADRALRQIAAGERVHEGRRIRARDLDDPLDADIPQRDPVQERPVLLDRVAVVARQVHVVVDVVRRAAGFERLLEERRPAVPRPEVQGRGRRAFGDGSRGGRHGGDLHRVGNGSERA